MGAILAKGQEFFVKVLATYGKDFGIDYDAIHQKLLEQNDRDAEQTDSAVEISGN